MENLRHQFEVRRFGVILNERERIERIQFGGFREMVAGFCFDDIGRSLALIEKQKPKWQIGKLNAIGGKTDITEHKSHIDSSIVSALEDPETAMEREFQEETGVFIHAKEWIPFVTLSGKDFVVYFYKIFNTEYFRDVTTNERETVYKCMVTTFLNGYRLKLMYNLLWMIPMCLDRSIGHINIQEN